MLYCCLACYKEDFKAVKIEDSGVILKAQKFKESAFILSVFSCDHGLIKGVFRTSRKNRYEALVGNVIDFNWSARLREHLGNIVVENCINTFSHISGNRLGILLLNSSISLCLSFMHEMEPHHNLYHAIFNLIRALERKDESIIKYLDFEIEVLTSLGFGMDLSKCVVSKSIDDLAYISPKSGCAVSKGAGEQYKDKLIKLPIYLKNRSSHISVKDALEVLEIISYFLDKFFFNPYNKRVPQAREDLIKWLNYHEVAA